MKKKIRSIIAMFLVFGVKGKNSILSALLLVAFIVLGIVIPIVQTP